MTALDVLPVAIGVGGVMLAGLVAYLEVRMRKVFATREELNGLGQRLDSCETRGARIETIAEKNDKRLSLMEERREADKELLAATLAEPLKQLIAKVDALDGRVTTVIQEHGQKIGEHTRDLSSLGRNLDRVSDRVEKLETRP